jgi:hypothetical protein
LLRKYIKERRKAYVYPWILENKKVYGHGSGNVASTAGDE